MLNSELNSMWLVKNFLIFTFLVFVPFLSNAADQSPASEQKKLDQELLTKINKAVYLNENHTDAIKALLEGKANVHVCDSKTKNTPLHLAFLPDFHGLPLDVIRSLIEQKAEVDAQNEQGNTPLHLAAAGNKQDLVKLLLDNKASPGIKNGLDSIPLHHASDFGIRALLRKAQITNDAGSQKK